MVASDWKKKDKGDANQLIYTHTLHREKQRGEKLSRQRGLARSSQSSTANSRQHPPRVYTSFRLPKLLRPRVDQSRLPGPKFRDYFFCRPPHPHYCVERICNSGCIYCARLQSHHKNIKIICTFNLIVLPTFDSFLSMFVQFSIGTKFYGTTAVDVKLNCLRRNKCSSSTFCFVSVGIAFDTWQD